MGRSHERICTRTASFLDECDGGSERDEDTGSASDAAGARGWASWGGRSQSPRPGSEVARERWPRGGVCSAASRAPPRGLPSSPTQPVAPGRNREEEPQPEPPLALRVPAGVGASATTQGTRPWEPQDREGTASLLTAVKVGGDLSGQTREKTGRGSGRGCVARQSEQTKPNQPEGSSSAGQRRGWPQHTFRHAGWPC